MPTDAQRAWANGQQRPAAYYRPPKLTAAQRGEIRRRVADGEGVQALAAEYGVSTRTIRQNS